MSSIIKLNKLETPIFQLDGGEVYDPISCLSSSRCKPLKKVSKLKVDVLVLSPRHMNNGEKQALHKLLSDLKKGVEGVRRKKWKGFYEVFNIELKLEFDEYDVDGENYVKNILQKLDEHSKAYDLLVIYMPEDTRSRIGGPYFKVKAYAIVNKIKEQIVIKPTIDKVIKYNSQGDMLKYNDLVWNLALSIFTKLGGVPWKLKECMSPVDVFLALSTIMRPGVLGGRYKAGVAVLQMYNNWGEYESSIYGKLLFIYEENKDMLNISDKEEDKFIQLVSTIAKEVKGKNVVVHLTDLYTKKFHELLYEILVNKGANNVKIVRIQESSPLRLYMNIKEASQAWPEVGVYWFLEPRKIAQLYTSGKWQYYPHKPPYAIPRHAIRPIQVSLEYSKDLEDLELARDDLRDILWLTKLYPYMLDAPRTRIPIDLRLSHKYAQIVASDENVGIPENVTFLY
ncbi:MAG: hypothetical protein GSR85_02310 [Desulfurococcales archaeon]|nr:hypothetical protein [Desulfurococcales archaeon]